VLGPSHLRSNQWSSLSKPLSLPRTWKSSPQRWTLGTAPSTRPSGQRSASPTTRSCPRSLGLLDFPRYLPWSGPGEEREVGDVGDMVDGTTAAAAPGLGPWTPVAILPCTPGCCCLPAVPLLSWLPPLSGPPSFWLSPSLWCGTPTELQSLSLPAFQDFPCSDPP
jgi:hypothetical protein